MDFPTFLNKWVIGLNPIKYTPFWYWYRFVNHSDWRFDDYQRWQDFWLNLNHGWDHMNYVHNFEEYWGEGSYPPERIVLSQRDYDALTERLTQPPDPKAIERLTEILRKPAPWDDDYHN